MVGEGAEEYGKIFWEGVGRRESEIAHEVRLGVIGPWRVVYDDGCEQCPLLTHYLHE